MGQQHRYRIQSQRALDYDARTHFGTVHRPREQALHRDEPMLAVEEGHLQVLSRFSAEPQPEERFARGYVT